MNEQTLVRCHGDGIEVRGRGLPARRGAVENDADIQARAAYAFRMSSDPLELNESRAAYRARRKAVETVKAQEPAAMAEDEVWEIIRCEPTPGNITTRISNSRFDALPLSYAGIGLHERPLACRRPVGSVRFGRLTPVYLNTSCCRK